MTLLSTAVALCATVVVLLAGLAVPASSISVSARGKVMPQSHPQLFHSTSPEQDTLQATVEDATIMKPKPTSANCTEHWFEQTIDHFSWRTPPTSNGTYMQRYFTYDDFWRSGCHSSEGPGPIFFYTGNEGDVTLYVNSTGLMWENAAARGARLVFAEHRYYGASQPFGSMSDTPGNLTYLSHEQALADYAVLLRVIREDMAAQGCSSPEDITVIAFGGSYGGMLSAWMRLKYPAVIAGSIAASAPILTFPGVLDPPYDSERYWQLVTNDASAAGGSAAACAGNVRSGFEAMFEMGKTSAGRDKISSIFGMCSPLQTTDDVYRLAVFAQLAWDSMAMGDFPYPSNYLTSGGPLLPAYPVRAACSKISVPLTDPWDLIKGLSDATAIFNNATQSVKCYDLPATTQADGIWDYQWCTELLPDEPFFAIDGVHDMFWNQPYNNTFINEHCQKQYGITPRQYWIAAEYGTLKEIASSGSNIVFSNGKLDPWSTGGVTQTLSDTMPAVFIADSAHHMDLMFSTTEDPSSVQAARQLELANIDRWIQEASEARSKSKSSSRVASSAAAPVQLG